MQINANGITLEVETYGPDDGIPLVFIRGLGSQLIHWPPQLYQGLADRGYRCVIFDNRDVGLSQRCAPPDMPLDPDSILKLASEGSDIPAPYSLTDMANDVIGILDALGIQRAHIFGISMGGAIAQMLCIQHARRLLTATIVMTACRPFFERSSDLGSILPTLLSYPLDHDAYVDAWVEEHANHGSPGFPMTETEIRAEAEKAWSRGVDADGINRQLLAVMNTPDRRPLLRAVELPCQVIHGVDDALIPVALGEEIAAHIPNCDYHALAGMGHIITPKLAPRIVDLVDSFIRNRSSG